MVQQSLGEGPAYALRCTGHQGHFAVHVHGGSLLRGWWASSASLLRYRLYGPLRAPVQRRWELALLPVGGDETIKPEPRKPSMCHLPWSSGSSRGDFCLLGFQLLPIPLPD